MVFLIEQSLYDYGLMTDHVTIRYSPNSGFKSRVQIYFILELLCFDTHWLFLVHPLFLVFFSPTTDEVHIQNVPLDAITFCASDNRYPRIFTFVARAESGYMCHVFYCRHVSDVDRLTRDFDDAFRNCYADYQQGGSGGRSTAGTVRDQITSQGIRDPGVAQAVEAALHPRPSSRYMANVKGM